MRTLTPLVATLAALALMPSTARCEEELRPRTKTYEPGKPIPDGYHYEEHRRDALAVGGGLMIVPGALLFAAGALITNKEGTNGYGPVAMVGGGALAAAGTTLLIIGLTTSRKLLVRNDYRITLAPAVSRDAAGLALGGSF